MHFLRLIRPVNLLVIALTMYAVRVFFLPYMSPHVSPADTWNSEPFDYFLLVLSTMIIAAGGNIINDYFDVKADRINKPEKLIITKYIKPRWAILTHWIFNFIAFAIACYLSWRYETFWYMFIHLLSINALWFYSMYFKRRFLIGNLIIAALTGLVPILCGIHFLGLTHPFDRDYLPSSWHIAGQDSWVDEVNLKIFFVLFFAIFAASLNLVREIIKDIEDVEGDLVLRAKTLPIVLGKRKTKWVAIGLLILILLLSSPFIGEAYTIYNNGFLIAMAPALLVILGIFIVIIQLWNATEKQQLKRADLILKLVMMIGCCMPFYWYFL
jgi:4-hydroxybenzoate polyprenyltransferase